jgi:large subunit ribosomal protein L22
MSEADRYAAMTVDELGAELETRGLPKSGKKDELIARLLDDDTAQGGTAPEDESTVDSRQSAEAGPGGDANRKEPARPAPRRPDGAVEVRAKARFVRTAPRKARLVMDHIRGKDVGDARALLRHTPRAAATDISKLLESAVANAENNFELDPGELKIARAFVDEGPTIKRFRPRALGRATPIHKRTSHMTITLTTTTKDAPGTRGARKAE